MGVVKAVKLEKIYVVFKWKDSIRSATNLPLKLVNNLTCKQNQQKFMTNKFKHTKSSCSGGVLARYSAKQWFFLSKKKKKSLNWLCHIVMDGETQKKVCHPFPQPSQLLLLMSPARWKQCGPSTKRDAFGLMAKLWSEWITGAEVTFNYYPCFWWKVIMVHSHFPDSSVFKHHICTNSMC